MKKYQVVEVVNDALIQARATMSGSEYSIRLYQNSVIKMLMTQNRCLLHTHDSIFDMKLLDFEGIFRKKGWDIEYINDGTKYWLFKAKLGPDSGDGAAVEDDSDKAE